jgi:PHD and RING finger domain-containing protein 1
LETFAAGEVATPDICDHSFCVGCLERWSMYARTCPVDREVYDEIIITHYPDGGLIRRIIVRPLMLPKIVRGVAMPRPLFCAFCSKITGRGFMYLCLRCGHMYHSVCLRAYQGNSSIYNQYCACPFCYVISVANHHRGDLH